jgi:hypothetical protein
MQLREEKQRRAIRQAMRVALANGSPDRQLPQLIGAIEEELYMKWGKREPMTITPHQTAEAVREYLEQEAQATQGPQELMTAA